MTKGGTYDQLAKTGMHPPVRIQGWSEMLSLERYRRNMASHVARLTLNYKGVELHDA